MGNPTYQRYLQSDHWHRLRAKKWSKPNRRCAICGRADVPLDLHHMKYRGLYDVTTDLLRLLCRECHYAAHEVIKSGKVRFKKTSHQSRFASLRNATRIARGLAEPRWVVRLKLRRKRELKKAGITTIKLPRETPLLDRVLIVHGVRSSPLRIYEHGLPGTGPNSG